MQCANLRTDFAAQPRGGQFIRKRQQFVGKRPAVDLAQPLDMPQHAMQPCQPAGLRLAAVDGHGLRPALERRDIGRNQDGAAGGLRQNACKVLSRAMIGDEHRQPGQVGQAVGVVVQQGVGDGVRQGWAAQGFQAD